VAVAVVLMISPHLLLVETALSGLETLRIMAAVAAVAVTTAETRPAV
jgi:hypothetical protein